MWPFQKKQDSDFDPMIAEIVDDSARKVAQLRIKAQRDQANLEQLKKIARENKGIDIGDGAVSTVTVGKEEVTFTASMFPLNLSRMRFAPPELAFANRLIRAGYVAFRTENSFWWALQSLLYYEEIYADIPEVTFPGYQDVNGCPSDFFQGPAFYTRRKALLQRKNQQLLRVDMEQEVRTRLEKYGAKNMRHFIPDDITYHGLLDLAAVISPKSLVPILDRVNSDITAYRMGFPDLIAHKLDGSDLQFIEIKREKEQLSAEQSAWLDFLNTNKVRARVVRVQMP